MPAHPDLATYLFEMEKLVEAQPDSVVAEIARGAYPSVVWSSSPTSFAFHGVK